MWLPFCGPKDSQFISASWDDPSLNNRNSWLRRNIRILFWFLYSPENDQIKPPMAAINIPDDPSFTEDHNPPFLENHQLCDRLKLSVGGKPESTADPNLKPALPGQPSLLLQDDANPENPRLFKFLCDDLETTTLNQLAPRLYPFAKHDSALIDPLHEQILKGRSILITEDPGLHLVWFYNKIYIKPLPEYLGNYAFWKTFICDSSSAAPSDELRFLKKSSYGFLRTYAYLIRHRSDFRTAVDCGLIPGPSDTSKLSWEQFSAFIAPFRDVDDSMVSPRYTYGQLRLTRLNWVIRLFAPRGTARLYYRRVYWQTSDYFERYFYTFLFLFAAFALILTAMQVILAAEQFMEYSSAFKTFARISSGFSIFTIVGVSVVFVSTLTGVCISLTSQLVFGCRWEHRRANRYKRA